MKRNPFVKNRSLQEQIFGGMPVIYTEGGRLGQQVEQSVERRFE
jgi:hypothetical protein